MLPPLLTEGFPPGAAVSGFFVFYVSRTPHVSKGLNGLRGREHTAPIHPRMSVASLSVRD